MASSAPRTARSSIQFTDARRIAATKAVGTLFLTHNFHSPTNLKRDTHGVIEIAGNKSDLERDFDGYLRGCEEDVNPLT